MSRIEEFKQHSQNNGSHSNIKHEEIKQEVPIKRNKSAKNFKKEAYNSIFNKSMKKQEGDIKKGRLHDSDSD